MTQITINNVFEKIRTICKEYPCLGLPERSTIAENSEIIQAYLKTLDNIRLELARSQRLQEEYLKLQRLLQKSETELRRRVGIENELKLYIEALKQENQQLECQKLQFLENTKIHIKQLKKVNQHLFIQLNAEVNKGKTIYVETNEKTEKTEKTQKSNKKVMKQKVADINKSLNKNKVKRQKSIKEIIKTQFIERQKFNTETKKTRKIHHYKLHSSIMSEQEGDNSHLQQNLRTYQEHNAGGRNPKNTQLQLIKGNTHLVSQQALNQFFDQPKITSRKLEREKNTKTPIKLERRDNFNKSKVQNLSRHLSRQRKHNKSVYSVLSAEQSQNQKQIF